MRYLNDDGTLNSRAINTLITNEVDSTHIRFVKYETGSAVRHANQIKIPETGTDINRVGSCSDAESLGEFDTL